MTLDVNQSFAQAKLKAEATHNDLIVYYNLHEQVSKLCEVKELSELQLGILNLRTNITMAMKRLTVENQLSDIVQKIDDTYCTDSIEKLHDLAFELMCFFLESFFELKRREDMRDALLNHLEEIADILYYGDGKRKDTSNRATLSMDDVAIDDDVLNVILSRKLEEGELASKQWSTCREFSNSANSLWCIINELDVDEIDENEMNQIENLVSEFLSKAQPIISNPEYQCIHEELKEICRKLRVFKQLFQNDDQFSCFYDELGAFCCHFSDCIESTEVHKRKTRNSIINNAERIVKLIHQDMCDEADQLKQSGWHIDDSLCMERFFD